MKFTGKIFLATLINLYLLSIPISYVLAENFSVSPLIIDVNAEARDVLVQTITLTNFSRNPIRLYASVNEITIGDNSEIKSFVPASMSNRAISVTSWIEISRSRIDIKPGEKNEMPLTIKINPNTPPGLYHAFIGFAPGPNRDVSEATVLSGQGSGLVLRISVGGKQEEFLKLVSFTTDRFSLSNNEGEMTYVLENIGDVSLAPSGDIIIYDTRGTELASVELNKDKSDIIAAGESKTYTTSIPFVNRLGKNKAFLSLEYGVKNKAALYDTNFYYSLPWVYLISIVLLLIVVLGTVVFLFNRKVVNEYMDDSDEPYELPLYVRERKDHNEYEHDIDLKKHK